MGDLGEDLDKKVQLYLSKVRDGGGVVTSAIVVAAARGILLSSDRSKLTEVGGYIKLNRHWTYSLLACMHFVKRKAFTSKSRYTPTIAMLKEYFNEGLWTVVTMENIPPELVLNRDQTGIKIVPTSSWTMNQQGAKRVEVVGSR